MEFYATAIFSSIFPKSLQATAQRICRCYPYIPYEVAELIALHMDHQTSVKMVLSTFTADALLAFIDDGHKLMKLPLGVEGKAALRSDSTALDLYHKTRASLNNSNVPPRMQTIARITGVKLPYNKLYALGIRGLRTEAKRARCLERIFEKTVGSDERPDWLPECHLLPDLPLGCHPDMFYSARCNDGAIAKWLDASFPALVWMVRNDCISVGEVPALARKEIIAAGWSVQVNNDIFGGTTFKSISASAFFGHSEYRRVMNGKGGIDDVQAAIAFALQNPRFWGLRSDMLRFEREPAFLEAIEPAAEDKEAQLQSVRRIPARYVLQPAEWREELTFAVAALESLKERDHCNILHWIAPKFTAPSSRYKITARGDWAFIEKLLLRAPVFWTDCCEKIRASRHFTRCMLRAGNTKQLTRSVRRELSDLVWNELVLPRLDRPHHAALTSIFVVDENAGVPCKRRRLSGEPLGAINW
jgi:hypothetical protein